MSTTPISTTGLAGAVAWPAVAAIVVLALVAASVRVVPFGQSAVIRRFGRLVRVAGPGVVLRLPGLHQVTLVSHLPVHCPLVVTALTRDGVHIHLVATATCRIVDAGRSGGPDPLNPAVMAVEDALAHWVGQTELVRLLQARADAELQLPSQVSARTAEWGVRVLEIEVSTIETELTADLLRLVDGPTGNDPGQR